MSASPASDSTAQPSGFLLEEKKRLSESILWELQRRFYDERGLGAWDSGPVPSYVTSNPYIAATYAQLVLQFLREAVSGRPGSDGKNGGITIDPSKPIYIVELAAGHGRFSFLFLKKFFALLDASSLRGLQVRYVMSDFTQSNLRGWLAQPMFKPFVDAGRLDFGLFDLEKDSSIKLIRSGQTLGAGQLENPLIVFANYIFDTVTQDLFRVEGGNIHEVRVTTRHASPEAPDLTNPEVMSQFSLSYEQRPADVDNYYPESYLKKLLMLYRERLADTTIAIPTGSLRGLSRLQALANGRMLLLSSDKGYTHEDELFFLSTQHIQFHGSLSMMVNYHAIVNGLSLALSESGKSSTVLSAATAQRQINLKTAAVILGAAPEQFRDTLLLFQETVDTFGPYDFYTLGTQVRQHTANASLEQILGLIRMSQFDPNVVFDYGRELLEQSPSANDTMRAELSTALLRCWENFYPLGRDFPFEVARVLLALRRPREAIAFNEHSLRLFGDHPVTYGNMGICHYHAEQPEQAIRSFERALELNPNYGLPRAWRARVMAELGRK
jgi:tetratricopeptide (TPR) repeat protein